MCCDAASVCCSVARSLFIAFFALFIASPSRSAPTWARSSIVTMRQSMCCDELSDDQPRHRRRRCDSDRLDDGSQHIPLPDPCPPYAEQDQQARRDDDGHSPRSLQCEERKWENGNR